MAALALACGLAGCRWLDDRPSILLIVLDTVRADHLSLYGYPYQTTPTLDALGEESVVYTQAIAPGTWTPPSHASLFTGLMPSAHRVERARAEVGGGIRALQPDLPVLAEALGDSGYRTVAYVANHGFMDPVFGLARGFERYTSENLRPADRLAARVVGWIERDRRGPFFLFLNVMDAHGPYKARPGYAEMFGPADGLPDVRDPGGPDPVEAARRIAQYDGEIRWIDDQLARIFEALRRVGRWNDTMIVVTADHGELFGEEGRWGHGGEPIYPLVHVPLVVKYPGGQPRGRIDRPVSLAGVTATALAIAGVPPFPGSEPALADAGSFAVSEAVRDDLTVRVEFDANGRPARSVGGDTRAGSRPGPIVYPQADAALADKLRTLGYIH